MPRLDVTPAAAWRARLANDLAPREGPLLGLAADVVARCLDSDWRLDPRDEARKAGLRGDQWNRAVAALGHRGWLALDDAGRLALTAPDDVRAESVAEKLAALFASPEAA